jgi:hypothetical protein
MKPKPSVTSVQPDFFQTERKSIINLQHPLVKLAEEFNWNAFEKQMQPSYSPTWAPLVSTPGSWLRFIF